MPGNNDVEIIIRANAARFIREVDEAKRRFAQSMGGVSDSARKESARASAGVAALTKRLLALGATYLSIRAAANALKDFVSVASRFEILRVQLESVMGGLSEGRTAFEWIKEFARTTPQQIGQVMDAFAQMKATGLDPMDGSLKKLVDATNMLGGSQQKLESIIRAVSQMWSKGKIMAQEMNLQLAEQGVPAWNLLSKATGKSVKELMKMSEAGELGRDAIRLLIDEIGRWAEGASEKQMKTTVGLLSNLADQSKNFLDAIARSGSLDTFKSALAGLLKTIEKLEKEGKLEQWAREISDFLSMPLEIIQRDIENLQWLNEKIDSLTFGLSGLVQSAGFEILSAMLNPIDTLGEGIERITLGMIPNYKRAADEARAYEAAVMKFTGGMTRLSETQKKLSQEGFGGSALSARLAEIKKFGALAAQFGAEDSAVFRDLVNRNIAAAEKILRSKQDLVSRLSAEEENLTSLQKELEQEKLKAAQDAIKEKIRAEEEWARDVARLRDESLRKEKEYADEIKRLREGQADMEERFAAIRGRGMNEARRQAEMEKRALDLVDRRGAYKGSYSEKEIADFKARAEAAMKLAENMKDNAKATAIAKRAMERYTEANDKQIKTAEKKKKEEADAAEALQKGLYQSRETLAALKKELEGLKPDKKVEIQAKIDQAQGAIAKIRASLAELKDKTVTVTVKTAEAKAAGGPAGFARGGALPGFGGGDIVRAFLEPGEWVIRKEAVRRYGSGLFHLLNSMRLPMPSFSIPDIPIPAYPRYATGGPVAASGPAETIRLEIGGSSIETQTPRDQVKNFIAALHEAARGGV